MKFRNTPIINTSRLSLRFINDADMDDVIELMTNSEISKTFMVYELKSREDEIKMFEKFKMMSNSEEYFVYGISLQGKMIGFINVVEIKGSEVEVGYVVHPNYKNNGFATEALGAAIQELLDSGYTAVKTGAFEDNIASIRVMQKCGMQRIEEEDFIEYRGRVHRCIYYKYERATK